MRRINEAALKLIKSFEGLKLKPYLDSVGIPTIGYGTIMYPSGLKVSMQDKSITEEQAEGFLMYEIMLKTKGVQDMVKVPLNDNEFGALVSFAYNCGVNALKGSTLLKMLNGGSKKEDVADQFLRWNKAGGKVVNGLTRRREAERSLFLQPVQENLLGDGPSDDDINVKLEDIEKDIL